jgi:hypothetical protein
MANVEKRALQIVVGIGCLVPIVAGAAGIVQGPAMLGIDGSTLDLDSHFRYLSGLLLGIGFGFASAVPRIETHGRRFRLLAGIVVVGGLGRLASLLTIGTASRGMLAALAMELAVTPLLAIWQWRIERRASRIADTRA